MYIEDRPTLRQLNEIMRIKDIEIASKWCDLGLELAVSDSKLKLIELDRSSEINTRFRLMFREWLDTTPDASWQQLVTALNNIKMKTAADAVSKLCKSG